MLRHHNLCKYYSTLAVIVGRDIKKSRILTSRHGQFVIEGKGRG